MYSLVSLFSGLIFAVAGVHISIKLARSLRILDFPGEIKIHKEPTPRFGGLGLVIGTLFSFLMVALVAGLLGKEVASILSGSLFMAITGAVDDIYSIKPLHKLMGQLASGVTFVIMFFMSLNGHFLSSFFHLITAVAIVLFISFMSNSLNLLDGMDGLAAGTTLIMAVFFSVLAFLQGKPEMGILLGALIGACLGFLVYNKPPAKTFMGDIGSLFLGYIIAVTALELVFYSSVSPSMILSIILILIVPIIDTCLAIIRRVKGHMDILSGDRFHLYDCIYRLFNGSIWKTLGVMWGITFISGLIGIVVFFSNPTIGFILSVIFGLGMFIFALKIGALNNSVRISRGSDVNIGV